MILLFYVDHCLMFSPSKDKIDKLYASLQEYFRIEYDGDLNKYLGIYLECLPDVPIYLSQPYLNLFRSIASVISPMIEIFMELPIGFVVEGGDTLDNGFSDYH